MNNTIQYIKNFAQKDQVLDGIVVIYYLLVAKTF